MRNDPDWQSHGINRKQMKFQKHPNIYITIKEGIISKSDNLLMRNGILKFVKISSCCTLEVPVQCSVLANFKVSYVSLEKSDFNAFCSKWSTMKLFLTYIKMLYIEYKVMGRWTLFLMFSFCNKFCEKLLLKVENKRSR